MRITQNTLRQIIKEELDAVMQEEPGILDRDVTGRKPSGAPMTAQARQDILDGYVAYVEEHMPNVSREAALKSAVDLFVDGGDQYLDQDSKHFDQSLYNKVVGKEPLDEEAPPADKEGPDEEELQRRMSKAVKNVTRMTQRAKEQGITNQYLAKKEKK